MPNCVILKKAVLPVADMTTIQNFGALFFAKYLAQVLPALDRHGVSTFCYAIKSDVALLAGFMTRPTASVVRPAPNPLSLAGRLTPFIVSKARVMAGEATRVSALQLGKAGCNAFLLGRFP